MQALIIVMLFLGIVSFGVIENQRNSSIDKSSSSVVKANEVASNIIANMNLYEQYTQVNYDYLHDGLRPIDYGIGDVKVISVNDIKSYDIKNVRSLVNLQVFVLSYKRLDRIASDQTSNLYLVAFWDMINRQSQLKNYNNWNVNMDEVGAQVGQILNQRVFRGNATFWIVPWVFSKTYCSAKNDIVDEVYTQVPAYQANWSKEQLINNFVHILCQNQQLSKGFYSAKYVYIQPIYKQAN